MKDITPYLLQVLIGLGVSAEQWMGYTFAGNLAFLAIWIMTLLSFFALAAPPEKLFENNKRRPVLRFMVALNLVLLTGIGWFFTAGAWAFAWLLIWGKRVLWEEEQKKAQAT